MSNNSNRCHIPPWRVILPVPQQLVSAITFSVVLFARKPTKYDVCYFRRMFGGAFMCNTELKVPFKYFLVFPKSEPGDLGQSAASGK